jgi:hypothetical protein
VRKQLFYLNNSQLSAYLWHGAVLTHSASFDTDDAGRALFGQYIAQVPAMPAYLLVDVIEEDFKRETVPHVSGRARAALIARKLSQMYRDTPFRHAILQGREKQGRRDDRYLFNALTKPDLPKSWLAVMHMHAVPLVGIYSLAVFSQRLFDRLAPDAGPVLLVSHQSSGLRQSFYQEGALCCSRLTPLFDHAPERLSEAFRIETNKTRLFMGNIRLLARGARVKVVVLASADTLAALAPDLADTAEVHYQTLELAKSVGMLRIGQFDAAGVADTMFLALLASSGQPSHFPLREQRYYYQLLRARIGLYAVSGMLALAALAWTAFDTLAVLRLQREAEALDRQAVATEARYRAVIHGMPATAVAAHNMRLVVDLETMIEQNVPLPIGQMTALSNALEPLPAISIVKLHWQAHDAASMQTAVDPAAPAPAPVAGDFPPPPGLLGIPGKTAQTMLIEGKITPFDGDYRRAMDNVAALAARLNRNAVVRAEVLVQPLDTRSTSTLENVAGAVDSTAQALFVIKATWKP